MSDAEITYTQIKDTTGEWWCATRGTPVTAAGVGDDQHEALEALLRAEHKATT